MSRTTKLISIPILICLAVSGCKNTPTAIDLTKSNRDESSETISHLTREELWADYGGENSLSIGENDTHVTAEISANCIIDPLKTRTIKFDLDIPETPDFTAYEYQFHTGGNYEIENLMTVFFGEERMKSIVQFEKDPGAYHGESYGDMALAHYIKSTAELQLNEDGAMGRNIFDENKLDSADKMSISITENEAIELCDKFLSDCGITGYKYDYTEYFGAIAENYYNIRYYYQLSDLPSSSWINDEKGFCYLTFNVTDDGITLVIGRLFDEDSFERGEKIDKTQIISPQEALQYVAEQAAVIRCGNYNPYFNKYYAEGEGLTFLPIREMKLGYWFSEKGGIKLAWIFYIGENGYNEKNATFAVDALSGKVCDE